MRRRKTTSVDELTMIGREVRRKVLETHRVDSCIYTTSFAVSVLRTMGYDAYPLPVQVAVLNRAMSEGRGIAGGGWGVGIGFGAEQKEGGWDGHLVAIVNRRYLCDFSIDQASRPEHQMEISVLVGDVGEPFLRGREDASFVSEAGEPVHVHYHAIDDQSFRASPDWERGRTLSITVERDR